MMLGQAVAEEGWRAPTDPGPARALGERPRVALCFARFGPYHRARAGALSGRCHMHEIEFSTRDSYAWTYQAGDPDRPRTTIFPDIELQSLAPARVRRSVAAVLASIGPDAVAVPGWSEPASLAALAWARSEGVPAILMSESSEGDARRGPVGELVKARLVRCFSAALVGGTRARDYAGALGMPPERIFLGYDAVDNEHFRRGAEAALERADGLRARLGAPSRFFLASARFIERKNLFRLLDAHARYRVLAGERAWGLVLLGDGELRPRLEEHARALGLGAGVLMPGFQQYEDLPAWYGLASAFVHASTVEQWGLVVNEAMAAGLPVLVSSRCGCAPDLVADGVNGFTFDPLDVEQLAGLMYRLAHGGVDRAVMGRASRAMIALWGPDRFAAGLTGAVEVALAGPLPRAAWHERLLLGASMFR
jgi:1,2-diacylglycerol 3-alpha-glucosyltransferase